MFRKFVLLISFIVLLCLAGSIQAEEIVRVSDADTYIRDDSTNYGDVVYMYLNASINSCGYVRFDLSEYNIIDIEDANITLVNSGGAPRNDSIVNGRFALNGLDNVAGNTAQDWDEMVLTSDNVGAEWSTNGGEPLFNVTVLDDTVEGITESITNPTGGDYWVAGSREIVVSGQPFIDFLQSRVDDDGLVTFVLEFPGSDGRGYGLCTKEYETEEYRPVLRLTATTGAKTFASEPIPEDEAPDVGCCSTNLGWTPGVYADKHDIYFGASLADVTDANRTNDLDVLIEQDWEPNNLTVYGLEPGETYYWKVDEVNDANAEIFPAHFVWSFTVSLLKASAPLPYDDEICVFYDPCAVLSWNPGSQASESRLYFGQTPGSLVWEANIPHDDSLRYSYDMTGLADNNDYYWRVDEANDGNVWTGDEWHFATIPIIISPDAHLKGWWKFDEGLGKAIDWSGLGQHGTVYGGAESVEGYEGDAISMNGDGQYVKLPVGDTLQTLDSATITTWVNFSNTGGAWQRIFDFGVSDSNGYMFLTPRQASGGVMRFAITLTNWENNAESIVDGPSTLPTGWHHTAVAINADAMEIVLFLDGVEAGFGITDVLPSEIGDDLGIAAPNNWLGHSQYAGDADFEGLLDDFRIYDFAMTEENLKVVMASKVATHPEPANNATGVYRYPTLTWDAGAYAAGTNGHELYYGTDFDDVNGRVGDPVVLNNPTYSIPGPNAPYDSLEVVYWVVDEVNDSHPDLIWPGSVWTFTIRDATLIDDFETYASSDLDPTEADDLRLVWIDGQWDYYYPPPLQPVPPGSSGGFVQLATDERDVWDAEAGANYEHYQPASTVRNGSDSMKFYFDNDGTVQWQYNLYPDEHNDDLYIYPAPKYSEARAAIVDAGIIDAGEGQQSLKMINDWSGYKLMRVSFYGDANNSDMTSSDKLFVTLADDDVDDVNSQVQYHPDVDSLSEEWWHDWYIPMNAFTDDNAGLNMENIYRIHVGVGHRVNRPTGGTGLIFLDDLQLYSTGLCIAGTVDEDFTGDCEVDNADLDMMTGIWLNDVTTTPVIEIDASELDPGTITSPIANQGSYDCNFVDFNDGDANDNPVVGMVAGEQCITFDANQLLISDANAPDSITGSGPFTVVYKVYNPQYDEHGEGDEEVFMWAKRDTTNRYAAVCIGSNPDFGAGAFWADGDIGFNQLPAEGQWHEILMIYEGRTDGMLYLWVDGHLDNSDGKDLNPWPDCPMVLGAAYDGDPYVDAIPQGLTVNPNYKFTGSLAYLAVYDYAVPVWQLEDWEIGDAIPSNPVNLYNDSVIDFKDLAKMGLKWMETPTLLGD